MSFFVSMCSCNIKTSLNFAGLFYLNFFYFCLLQVFVAFVAPFKTFWLFIVVLSCFGNVNWVIIMENLLDSRLFLLLILAKFPWFCAFYSLFFSRDIAESHWNLDLALSLINNTNF